MDDQIKISAGASRTLNALLSVADDYAFAGSMHPDDRHEIEAKYKQRVCAMRKLIARLEARE